MGKVFISDMSLYAKKFKENVPLRGFSNYKIGGPARFFFEPKTEAELRWAVKTAKAKKLPVFVLGGGTNLLIDDAGWNGLVVRPTFGGITVRGRTMSAGAGVAMSVLLNLSTKKSLSGFEWAGGLPGFLGGAIRGNAGCFGGEIKDIVASVRSFDMVTMKTVTRTARECRFGYRTSIFKKKNGREIILSAVFTMKKGDKKKIARDIKEKIDYRKKTQPLEYPNIGSIFKNVALAVVCKKGGKKYEAAVAGGALVFRGSDFSVKNDPFPVISTAKLIAEAGLRGAVSGGALISPKHPNFIVNSAGASSLDVKNLIALVKRRVRAKFGVVLKEEVQII